MVAKNDIYYQLKHDANKPRLDLIDPFFIEELGRVLTYGAKKYEDNSWRIVPEGNNRYYAAVLRHLMAWREGEIIDCESGLHHLWHAACNIMFLCYFEREVANATNNAVSTPTMGNK